MITSIAIENLRGIAEGKLEGLAPLTILTGPNASGKSTVLDALLIGGSPRPGEAVGRAVERHPQAFSGARWLFGSSRQEAVLSVVSDSGKSWSRTLQYYDYCNESLEEQLVKKRGRPPYSMVDLREDLYADNSASSTTGFSSDNLNVERRSGIGLSDLALVRLVDPGLPLPLHRSYTEVMKEGNGAAASANEALRELIPGLQQLVILVESGDVPVLHATVEGKAVPVALSGDGIYAHTQLVLETAVDSGSLLLVEEPEVYQHPKAIWRTARVLLGVVGRGAQIVLTTHSLELIDALISQAEADDVEKMALFNLKLHGGDLKTSRRAGKDLIFARQQMEADLR